MPWRIGVAILAVAGVAFSLWLYFVRERALTIDAGTIAAPAVHQLKTSFTIRRPGLIEAVTRDYRRSHGMAGACMMADVSAIPALANATDQEACNAGLPDQSSLPEADRWAAYFINGKCWFRGSGKTYCVKNSTHNGGQPWTDGTIDVPMQDTLDVTEIYDEVKRRGVHGRIALAWRTEACLNPVDPADKSKDVLTCGGEPGPSPLRDSAEVLPIP